MKTGSDDVSLTYRIPEVPSSSELRILRLELTRFLDYDVDSAKPCAELDEIITIDDPSPGYRTVSPGQEFTAVVLLSERYEGVKDILGQCDLVAHWSFKMYTEDRLRFPRMAGSVVIPATLDPVFHPEIVVLGKAWTNRIYSED